MCNWFVLAQLNLIYDYCILRPLRLTTPLVITIAYIYNTCTKGPCSSYKHYPNGMFILLSCTLREYGKMASVRYVDFDTPTRLSPVTKTPVTKNVRQPVRSNPELVSMNVEN